MVLRILALLMCLTVMTVHTAPVMAATNKQETKKQKTSKNVRKAAARPMANPTSNPRFAALIIDAATGQVLQSAAADEIRHPASLTKMMTLYLAFQALDAGKLRLQDELYVSSNASSMSPSKLGLRAGERITVENAILGLVTESANDAAVTVAEALGGGSESRFAYRMTQTARQLGMRDTTYKNASGLPDDEQVTTARDMARLALALQRHFPRYYHYFSTPAFTYKGRYYDNHNHLMERYEGMDGIKTGYVRASGFNLVASVKRGNKRLIGVIFGGPSAAGRDAQLARMLDVAFASINGGGQLPQTQMASADAPVKLNSGAGAAPITQAMAAQARQDSPPVVPAAAAVATQQQQMNNLNNDLTARVARLAAVTPQADASLVGEGDAEDATAQNAAGAVLTAQANQQPAQPVQPVQQQPQTMQVASAMMPPTTAALVQSTTTNAAQVEPQQMQPQPQVQAQPQVQPAVNPLVMPAAMAAPAVEKAPAVAAAAPAKGGRNWGIQVGAYNDRASGQRATALVADSMPDLLKQADARVLAVSTASGKIYRARLIGLDEREARQACTRLSGKGKPCLTLPPNGTVDAWLASAGQ